MFIKNCKLENFGNVSNAFLEFSEGINLFSGNNGQGKSTILKAISILLYNHYQLTLKDYIKWYTNEFFIKIEFSHLTKNYVSSLRYSEKNGSNRILLCKDTNDEYKNSAAIEYLNNLLDTKRAIASTMSFEHEIDLITTSPSERREYLKGIFDLRFISQLQQIEKDLKDANEEATKLATNIGILESQVFEQLQLSRLPIDKETYETKTKLKDSLYSTIALLEQQKKQILEQKERVEKIEFSIYKKNKMKDDLTTTILNDKNKLESIVEDDSSYNDKIVKIKKESLEKNKLLKIRINSNEDSIEVLQKKITEMEKNKEELSLLKIEQNNILLDLSDKTSQSFLKAKLKKEQLLKMNKGTCPICGQEITEAHIKETENEIKNYDLRLTEFKIQKEKASKDYTNTDKELINLDRKTNDFINQKSRFLITIDNDKKALNDIPEATKKEVEHIELLKKLNKEQIQNQRNFILENIEKSKKQLGLIELEITDFENDLLSLKNKLLEMRNPDETILSKKEELKSIIELIKKYETIIISNKEKSELNKVTKRKEEEKNIKLIQQQKKIENLRSLIETYKLSKKILSSELPTYIISKMIVTLKMNVNEFLFKVYPLYELDIIEKGKALKIQFGDQKSDVKLASGFEKQIFSFAYKYALGKLQDYEILLLDEVDSAASEENSIKFYETLGKLESCFKQIFIITHKTEIKEILKNDFRAKVFLAKNGEYEINE